MTKSQQIIRAALLGTEAYKNQIVAACQDEELLDMVDGRKIGETPKGEASTVDILNAWNHSWHAANLTDETL